ncbi:MAG TPA: hypothetical protein VFN35_15800 [Ktedonobacteraceae bacterium]|nr:hypothetical protein [Ktedonobacteraceae bacterium]
MAQGNGAGQVMQSSGQSHRMSMALTIGATIGLIGLILLLYGLFGKADYNRSDNINVNLWWGLAMLIFGLLMSIGGAISSYRQRQLPGAEEQFTEDTSAGEHEPAPIQGETHE